MDGIDSFLEAGNDKVLHPSGSDESATAHDRKVSEKPLHVMNVEYEEQFGDVITHLWCRDEDDNEEWVEVEGHRPSFYIHREAYSKRVKNNDWVVDVEAGYSSIQGEELVRVFVKIPDHIDGDNETKGLREYFESTWEADISYCNQFLIDTGVKTHISIDLDETWTGTTVKGDYRVHVDDISAVEEPDWKATPRMVTVDIEVESPDGFPEPEDAAHPVTAITAYDNYDEAYTVWTLRHDSWDHTDTEIENLVVQNRPDDIQVGESEIRATIDDVHVYSDESSMLHDFNKYVERKSPNLLSGWHSSVSDDGSAFDYPYLINRCKNLNTISFRDWSPMGQVWNGYWGPGAKGIEFFDMMKAYEKTRWDEPDGGWSLANISSIELPIGKLEIDDIDDAWRDAPTDFLKYNIRDVQAVVGIDTSAEVLDLYQNLRKLTGAQFGDIDNNIDMLDVYILRFAKEEGVVLPTNTEPDRGWFYGGHNFEPKLGLHKNAVYPDVWSEYPNAFRTCNMSPETIIGTKEDLEASEYTEDDCRWSYIDTRPDNVKEDTDPDPEKCYYLKPEIKEGFMNKVVDHVMGLKDSYDGTELYGPVKQVVNSCFTPDTEVLTPNGVKNITDIDVGEDVYSWNPETNEMEVKQVVDTIEKPNYDGEIIHIQNDGMDLKVTPDHRFLVNRPRHMDDGEWEYTEAGNLNEWTHYETPNGWDVEHGDSVETIDILDHYDGEYQTKTIDGEEHVRYPEFKHSWVPRYYDGDTFFRFLSWVITEGHVGQNTSEYINITKYEGDEHDHIFELIESLGLNPIHTDTDIKINNTVLSRAVGALIGECAEEKQIPDIVFDASRSQKRLVLDTLMQGDGDSRETPKRYTTISDQLRDDFMRLVWELGYPVTYKWEDGKGRHGSGVWRIHWRTERTKQSFRCHRDKETETAENGVYCIQVEDNHTLVAGRNGKFTNIPNCWGVYGDSDSYGKGYRLFDWRVAESITLYGQTVIKNSAEKFVDEVNNIKDERGYDGPNAYQVGGDTDSIMTSVPFVDDPEIVVDIAQEACERVNDWYGEMALEEFNCPEDDHYIELEIESYATDLFVPAGKNKEKSKKKYAETILWDEGTWFDEPEFSITGMDTVRSDRAQATRETVQEVVETILRVDDPEAARKTVYDIIDSRVEEIKSGERPNSYIARPKGMSKPPEEYGSVDQTPMPTYRGAKYANQNFDWENLDGGSKPQLLYIDKVRGDWPKTYSAVTKEDGRAVDAIAGKHPDKVPDSFVVDHDKMITKTLQDPLEPILDPMENWTWEDALADTDQSQLASFF